VGGFCKGDMFLFEREEIIFYMLKFLSELVDLFDYWLGGTAPPSSRFLIADSPCMTVSSVFNGTFICCNALIYAI